MSWRSIERLSRGSALGGITDQVPVALPPRPGGVTGHLDLRVLELLTARLCHDLIGPIAAINNGVELLADEPVLARGQADPDFMHDAIAIVGDSASRAAGRLQFYRFAYGAGSGSATAGPTPDEIAIGFFAESRISGNYAEGIRMLSCDRQKLACNLLSVGADALPRGGRQASRPGRAESLQPVWPPPAPGRSPARLSRPSVPFWPALCSVELPRISLPRPC